jgi:hypothetical protein
MGGLNGTSGCDGTAGEIDSTELKHHKKRN